MSLPIIETIDLVKLSSPIILKVVQKHHRQYWETVCTPHPDFSSRELKINLDAEPEKQYALKQSVFTFLGCNEDIDLDTKIRFENKNGLIQILYFIEIDEEIRIPVFPDLGQRIICTIYEKRPVIKFQF